MNANQKLNKLTEDVVKVVKNVANEKVHKIYLYGSYARGDFDGESDIDIMVILDCKKNDVQSFRRRMCYYASRLGLEYDIEVSILMRDKENFYNNQDIMPFYQNIINEGIEIYG